VFRGNERFPDGIEYAFDYQGVHERHVGDDVERIEFPGYEALLRWFVRELPDEHAPEGEP
jgi:hypothetical protein